MYQPLLTAILCLQGMDFRFRDYFQLDARLFAHYVHGIVILVNIIQPKSQSTKRLTRTIIPKQEQHALNNITEWPRWSML